jgi:ribosomal protein L35AE/L33A
MPHVLFSGLAIGDKVRYIPGVAYGDRHHEACEDGVVTSIHPTASIVFVRFNRQLHSKACSSEDLVRLP